MAGRGVGRGAQLALSGPAVGDTYAFANGILRLGTPPTIPLAGNLGAGNFETEFSFGHAPTQIIAYAPDGGPSGIVQPDIIAPAAATVAQGSTLSPSISIVDVRTVTEGLQLSVISGTLLMNGATGSGTNSLLLSAPHDQVNADLASLTFVPAAGAPSVFRTIQVPPTAPASPRAKREPAPEAG